MGYRLGVIRAASRSSPVYAKEPTLCQGRVRRLRVLFDVRTAPRLHSSDDGLFLTTSTLRRLEEDVHHLAISAHSLSDPRACRNRATTEEHRTIRTGDAGRSSQCPCWVKSAGLTLCQPLRSTPISGHRRADPLVRFVPHHRKSVDFSITSSVHSSLPKHFRSRPSLRPRRSAPEALARRCARPRSAGPQKFLVGRVGKR
jgi:hypothetical protein